MLDNLKDNSLKAAGYGYLVGDASLFAAGMLAGRYKEASTGLLWGLGGVACARYGNPNAEEQLKLLSGRLAKYLHKQGVAIPHTPDLEMLTRHEGLVDRVEQFFFHNPSEILNAFYAVGGGLMLRSGLKNYGNVSDPWAGRMMTASGALVTAGGLAGLLIPEKQPGDKSETHHDFLSKAWDEIKRKPLRISGTLFALNNITLATNAYKEMKSNPAQKSYLFKYLTVASYLFGNIMLLLSSKENKGNQEAPSLEKLGEVSARVIAAQPQPLQEALVQQIAAFLSDQPQVGAKADEIAQLLYAKLAEVTKTLPAGEQGAWQNKVAAQPVKQTGPEV